MGSRAFGLAEALTGAGDAGAPWQVQVALNIPPYPHRPGMHHIDGFPPEPDGRPRTFTMLAGVLMSDQRGPDAGNLWVWPGTHLTHAAYFREHGPDASSPRAATRRSGSRNRSRSRAYPGEASGLAPLKGLSRAPADRDFLISWLKSLSPSTAMAPCRRPTMPDLRERSPASCVCRRSSAPSKACANILAGATNMGVAPASECWMRGRALGWAFDGDLDEVDLDAKMVGFDLTAILGNPEIINPAAHYLLYRIRSVIDGRRAVLISLDASGKAYLLHDQFLVIGHQHIKVCAPARTTRSSFWSRRSPSICSKVPSDPLSSINASPRSFWEIRPQTRRCTAANSS